MTIYNYYILGFISVSDERKKKTSYSISLCVNKSNFNTQVLFNCKSVLSISFE